MTKREIDRRIYLTGSKFGRDGYTVLHLIEGERLQIDCVPNVAIGNTIVRALRERAYQTRRT